MSPQRAEKLLRVLNRRQAGLTVVMENIEDPHNISAVLRTCDAVGIQDIYILNTRLPRHKKWGRRSSSSAIKWITVHQYDNLEECFTALRSKYEVVLSSCIKDDSNGLFQIDFTRNTALIFGNEHYGVTAEASALADGHFTIPQMGIIQSLNISVACAVSLYEALRQRSAAGLYDTVSLPPDRVKQLKAEWGFWEVHQQSANQGV